MSETLFLPPQSYIPAPPHGQELLQRAAVQTDQSVHVPGVVQDVLGQSGQPLETGVRRTMENRFDQDFSHVRVHTDAQAGESARAVNASAYTVNHHIVFGPGQYVPEQASGQHLMTHELAHVVQQSGFQRHSQMEIGQPNDLLEHEATKAADIASSGRPALSYAPGSAGGPLLQRQSASPGADAARPTANPAPSSMTIDSFELGKSDLTSDHKKSLAQDAATIQKILQENPDTFITIVGHTDAVGTEERNQALGQDRADAVQSELVTNGIPQETMHTASLGESVLLVQTQNPEPRNRRVEIYISPRSFFKPEAKITPIPSLKDIPNFKLPEQSPIITSTPPPVFDWRKPIPPAPPSSDPLDDALDRDPLLRSLPKLFRDAAKDALKEGDETLADKALDTLNTDGQTKNAIKSAVKALLQTLKGKKWKPPTQPLYELPPSSMPSMPKAPGEHIFTLPPIKWDFPSK